MKITKAYYINMDKDVERRQLLEARLERHHPELAIERIPAIDESQLAQFEEHFLPILPDHLKASSEGYPEPGTIGCWLSHRLVLQKIAAEWSISQDPEDIYLVLEDDCVFDQSALPMALARMHKYLPSDWTMVKHSLGQVAGRERVNIGFYRPEKRTGRNWNYYWGTHFLLYRGSAASVTLRMLDEATQLNSIDVWLREHISGLYSFAQPLHIKQSNLGGSNTNPEFASPKYGDPSDKFVVSSWPLRLMRRLKVEFTSRLSR